MYRVNPLQPCQAQQKAEVLSLDASASVRSEYRVEIRVFGRFRVEFKGGSGTSRVELGVFGTGTIFVLFRLLASGARLE